MNRFLNHVRLLLVVTLLAFSSLAAPAKPAGDTGKTPLFQVKSQPTGADVSLDETILGETPLTIEKLKPGLHSLTLRKTGFVPLKMQVYVDSQPVNLGEVPLAKIGSPLTIWRVGSPNQPALPAAQLPKELGTIIKELGFEVKVQVMSAKDFPTEYRNALSKGEAPDLVGGENFLPFQEIVTDPTVGRSLRIVWGVGKSLAPFVFVVPPSSNHAAARYVTLLHHQVALRHGHDLNGQPGQVAAKADRDALEKLSWKAMAAYVSDNPKALAAVTHPRGLGKQGCFFEKGDHHVVVAGMKNWGMLGNSRLAFVLGTTSYWADESLGCMEILSVWVKQPERWTLLTISNDPLTLQGTRGEIAKAVASLTEGKDQELQAAELVSPKNGELPELGAGQRFGDFTWNPSTSKDVIGEIAEFHYGNASRLFYLPQGQVSSGKLWTTGGPWSWRIWSIGKNGQLVLSESRNFNQ